MEYKQDMVSTVLLVLYPQIQWGGIMPGQGCYDWMYFPWWLESNLKCETDQWLNEPVWNKALFHDFRSICSIANWLILRSFTASSFKLTPLSNISRSWFWNSVSGLLALCSSGVSKYFFYACILVLPRARAVNVRAHVLSRVRSFENHAHTFGHGSSWNSKFQLTR